MAELVKLGPIDEALARRMAEAIHGERGGDLNAWVSTVVNALCHARIAEDPKVFEMIVCVIKDRVTGTFTTEVHLYGNGITYGAHTARTITSENEQLLLDIIGIGEILKLKGLAEQFGRAFTMNGFEGVAITAEQYRFFMGF